MMFIKKYGTVLVLLLLSCGMIYASQVFQLRSELAKCSQLVKFKDTMEHLGRQAAYKDSHGCSLLHIMAQNGSSAIGKILLLTGADLEAPIKDGETPLFLAAEKGHVVFVQMLLQAGASVDVVTNTGVTPLMKASENGHSATVSVLLAAGADTARQEKNGHTALGLANIARREETARILKEAGAPKSKPLSIK